MKVTERWQELLVGPKYKLLEEIGTELINEGVILEELKVEGIIFSISINSSKRKEVSLDIDLHTGELICENKKYNTVKELVDKLKSVHKITKLNF